MSLFRAARQSPARPARSSPPALLLIAISGVLLYLLMVGLNNTLLGHRHESSLAEER